MRLRTKALLRTATTALALLLSLAGWVHAQTVRPTITWLLWDFAPSTISSNGKPTDGYVYAVNKMLTEAWPEAQHNLVLTTTDNAWASLNRGVEACYMSAIITPQRERSYYLSQSLLIPPHSIIARADVAAKFPKNAAGEVLADPLFERKDLRGVLAQNRSYSVLLDALINRHTSGSGISRVKQLPGTNNILQMLASDHGDYTIEYAVSALYQLSQSPKMTQSQFKVLPIAGQQPVPVGVACPRTEWGRATITKVDALLSKIAARPDYFDALKRWQPQELQKYMAPYVKAFVKQRTQASDPARFGPP